VFDRIGFFYNPQRKHEWHGMLSLIAFEPHQKLKLQGLLETRGHSLFTDKLRSCCAAMKVIGNVHKHETGRWLDNRADSSHQPFQQ
jgi:putative transposase